LIRIGRKVPYLSYRSGEGDQEESQLGGDLTVVVATTEPWPHVQPCFNSLLQETRRVGGVLIVADGDGHGLPPEEFNGYPDVCYLRRPGASVFELRAAGVAQATTTIVATTEDHCIVGDGWSDRVIQAHKVNPEASVIGGAVLNGSPHRASDWANFLMTFAAFAPPISPSSRWAPPANISYKRNLLPHDPKPGWLDFEFPSGQRSEGRLVLDNRIVVAHVQSGTLF
jgi:hypothetical protein